LPLRANPPALGEHSEAVLRDVGYRDDEIAALRAARIIAVAEPAGAAASEAASA